MVGVPYFPRRATVSLRQFLRSIYGQEGFRGPVMTLFTGSSAALLLAYLCEPILTRLYTAADYKVMGYFTALAALLFSVSSLRYDDALMLQKEESDAASVVWLSWIVLLVVLLVTGTALFWGEGFAQWTNIPAIAPFLVLLAPTLLAMRLARTMELWLVRAKAFRFVMAGQAANTGVMVTSRIGVGVPPVSAGAGGLIGGYLAGNLVAALINFVAALRGGGRILLMLPPWRKILNAARRYRRFPLFSTPSSLVAALVYRLPVFLIPLFFVGDELGYYVKAFATLAIPLGLAGNAISRVFFVHAAEAKIHNLRDRLTSISTMVHNRLVMLGLFPTLVLMVAGPDIFAVVFGAPWRTAGTYAQYLGPWLLLGSIVSPLTRIFDVLERQRTDLATSTATCLLMVMALILGGQTGRMPALLLSIGIMGALARIGQLAILMHLAGAKMRAILAPYGKYLLLATPGIGILGAAGLLGMPRVTTATAAIAGLVFVALLLRDEDLLSGLGEKRQETPNPPTPD